MRHCATRRPSVLCGGLLAAALTLGSAGSAAGQVEISARGASLRIGGRVQTQFAHSSVGAGPGANFFFRRVRLTFDATLTDWLGGRVQPDFVGGLKDTYVRFTASPSFRLDFGHFKRAFDLFVLQSSADISVIERDGRIPGLDRCAGVGNACSPVRLTDGLEYSDRDIGVRVQGDLGPRISYQATLTNGTGLDGADENDAKSPAGRVVFAVTDRIRVGANASFHDYETLAGRSEFAAAWGADVEVGSYETEGPHVQLGLVGGDNWRDPVSVGDPSSFVAAQGIVSYYRPVAPGSRVVAVEPLARVSWADPNTGSELAEGGLLLTPGVMLFFAERNKIGANVDIYSPDAGETEWSFKVQSYFYF